MKQANRLGLVTVAITALAFGLTYGTWKGGTALYRLAFQDKDEPVIVAETTTEPGAVAGSKDSDGDGIPDDFEAIYKTDPNSPDTDQDGVDDLDEIQIGTDPLKMGPGDEIKPATGEDAFDTNTETGKYLASLPRDINRNEIISEARLTAYINENAGELLPLINDQDIKIDPAEGKEAITKYLDNVSSAHNKNLTAVTNSDIEEAFARQLADPDQIKNLVVALRQNAVVLKSIVVPAEALSLHKKYLTATAALADNVEYMASMQADLVKGLMGAKRIGDLAPIFTEIEQEIKALEAKYNLS